MQPAEPKNEFFVKIVSSNIYKIKLKHYAEMLIKFTEDLLWNRLL